MGELALPRWFFGRSLRETGNRRIGLAPRRDDGTAELELAAIGAAALCGAPLE
jgi:hypothetical protein